MLSPEYLRRITEGSEQIAEELHQYIISEIVSRMMARIGRGEDYILTNADAWRIRTLQESGELLEDVLAELSRYTKREQHELLEAFEDAGITAMNYDDKIYKAAGLSPVPLEQSPAMIRLMERNMLATMGEWKIYSRSGKSKKFPPFSLTGYGMASGLSGVNCRHSFGASDGEFNPYTELSAQDKANKGKQYEKEQRQRTYERRIRKTKREVLGMQAAVDNCKDEQAKFALQQDLDRKSFLLQKQNAAYKDYCKQNDLRELQDRLMIAKWNRQNAAKSRGAAKRYKTAKGID